ncbi:MFS transporter [Thiobacter aerophilum]|uniref:MFS transporter n=1 Tax=Thiobacter aerophilum TaxID=3121275 RepID=A0ABV0EDS8_9BURK
MARPLFASFLNPGVAPREMWAWALYDFANSGYTTVVITAVFNAYFVSVVVGNAPWATFAWTLALSVSYALIVLTAPVIGAYADAWAAKKRLLFFTTIGCVLFTAALGLVEPGRFGAAVAFILLSNFFYGTGENLIAAFLPELARPRAIGRVSAWGWSLGYLGGLVSLAACLAYIAWAEARGQTAVQFVPATMVITALFFALAATPTFLFLRERAVPQPQRVAGQRVREAFVRLAHTLREARAFRDLFRFLLCTLFYQAGIQAVIALAAIYAQQVMGFSVRETIELVFVVNITAALGALLFGWLQDRIGHVATIALTLVGWIFMVLLAYIARGPILFWLAANLAGISMGASQSAGRALVGLLSPAARRAEFFGLWGFAVKLASIFGPLTYGVATWVSRGNHRLAILIVGSYFVIGLTILAGVSVRRGRRAALRG